MAGSRQRGRAGICGAPPCWQPGRVARRVPVGGGEFLRAGWPAGYELRPLDDLAAALLEDRFPALAPRVRQRLLAEAQGNPLALLELPVALSDLQRSSVGGVPVLLPLSRRLQAMFASRISELPPATFHFLLLAVPRETSALPADSFK